MNRSKELDNILYKNLPFYICSELKSLGNNGRISVHFSHFQVASERNCKDIADDRKNERVKQSTACRTCHCKYSEGVTAFLIVFQVKLVI